MDLLENKLIQQYFGCENHALTEPEKEHMARRVIEAMHQPLKAGERYLGWPSYQTISQWTEQVYAEHEMAPGAVDFHPYQLRLPDRFQKKECMHCFCRVNRACCYCKEKKSEPPASVASNPVSVANDPVEKKISEFVNKLNRVYDPLTKSSTWWHGRKSVEYELRALVALVRAGKDTQA